MANSQSTLTLQMILDKVKGFGDLYPILGKTSGMQLEPFLTIAQDVLTDIYGQEFPYKWNEVKIPQFYSNSYQQDYVILNPDGSSFYNLEWLERGIVTLISSNQVPKPWALVETGRQLNQSTGNWCSPSWGNPMFLVNWFPNTTLYYGTWGAADSGNPTWGNNPGPNKIYTSPLTLVPNTPQTNPITQIIDPNGNYQVVTTYGTCGSTAPTWPAANATFGTTTTDGSVVWTVADPQGIGIRILPVPSQNNGTVFQFNLIGQAPPPKLVSLSSTLAPFPDKYEPYFRAGVIAQAYRYSPTKSVQDKFEKNYQIWLKSLVDLRQTQDREQEENRFSPERGIMGAGTPRVGWWGASYPFNGNPGGNW